MLFNKHIRKTGNWGRVKRTVANIGLEMRESRRLCLSRWGLKAEGIAKTHISMQDLGWKALKPATLARKVRLGQSTDILVATSTYFQNITSWTDGNAAYAGVKREVSYDGGKKVFEVARYLEFDSESGKNPARPLWQPTWDETMAWSLKHNSPVSIFLNRIRKY